MALFLDLDFASRVVPSLPKGVRVGQYLFGFRCPYCGDGKDPKKVRGTLYRHDGADQLTFGCYNCRESRPFWLFLKEQDPELYKEYMYARLNRGGAESLPSLGSTKSSLDSFAAPASVNPLDSMATLLDLSEREPDHVAVQYMRSRKMPKSAFGKTYFVEHFGKWCNAHGSTKELNEADEDPRIIVPMIDEKNILFGVQGRAIGSFSDRLRYVTVMFDETVKKAYGLHTLDRTKSNWVTEGFYDSVYFPNSMASFDGALHRFADRNNLDKQLTNLVFDNEPRNKHVTKSMRKAIKEGYKVAIWPQSLDDIKDVNEIFTGKPLIEARDCLIELKSRSFGGLRAQAEMALWMK